MMKRAGMIRAFRNSIAFGLALMLFGCGGGGSSSSDGSLTIRITDAPVDDLYEVWVTFSKVIVQPSADGLARLEYEINPPMAIELKSLGSGASVAIIDDEPLPAGDYSWVRLVVEPFPDTFVYETESDALADIRTLLDCPSCAENQSGLKLNKPFSVENEGVVDFTIDFDLRKSITDPVGLDGYKLRPTLRIVDTTVADAYFAGVVTDVQSTPGTPTDPVMCAVYVYEGAGITPDDNCVNDNPQACKNVGAQPLTSSDLEATATDNQYSYRTGWLYQGAYTVTLACGTDYPDADDDLTFIGTTTINPATAGENTVDFTITD